MSSAALASTRTIPIRALETEISSVEEVEQVEAAASFPAVAIVVIVVAFIAVALLLLIVRVLLAPPVRVAVELVDFPLETLVRLHLPFGFLPFHDEQLVEFPPGPARCPCRSGRCRNRPFRASLSASGSCRSGKEKGASSTSWDNVSAARRASAGSQVSQLSGG